MSIAEWIFVLGVTLVFYTYIGYGILLFIMVKIKESIHPRVPKQLPETLPHVTLLIAAYNEEAVVREKMANYAALDYPNHLLDICWVTDGSDDNTNTILSEYPHAKVLYQAPRNGKTAALNRAMPYIKSPITVFTDANTMLNSEAIKEIVKEFTDKKVGCVSGEKRIKQKDVQNAAAGEGIYWKYESALKDWDYRLYTAVGAAGELFSVRTHLFAELPNDTLLDDFMISMKIASAGYKIAYCKTAYAIEDASLNVHEEAKRKVRIAAGGLQSISRLWGLLNPIKYPILSFQYISHRVLRWSVSPVVLLLLLPLNMYLCLSDSVFYCCLMLGQILFYTAAYIGKMLEAKQVRNKFLFVPFYFMMMNINVIKALPYLLKHKGHGTWEKAKRAH